MIKIEFLSVRDLKWSGEDQRAIDCLVKINTIIPEVPFTASMNDVEPYGRELFARCVRGEFGAIAPKENRIEVAPSIKLEIPPERRILNDYLDATNRQIGLKSSHGIATVWASVLVNLLRDLVSQSRTQDPAKHAKVIPKNFSDLIKFAQQQGVVDDQDAQKLHHIRDVRNAAAHEWQLTPQNEKLLSSLRKLYEADHSEYFVFHEDVDFLILQIFTGSCARLGLKFARELHGLRLTAGAAP
jgi:intergrase/recombinase